MTSLPRGAPPPNTITLGVRVQHRTSGETQMFRPSHCPPPPSNSYMQFFQMCGPLANKCYGFVAEILHLRDASSSWAT